MLRNLTAHLNNLNQQNAALSSEIEKVAEEDNQIKEILNNKARILMRSDSRADMKNDYVKRLNASRMGK